MYEDEKTTEQPVASEEQTQTQQDSDAGQSVQAEELNTIPEKFVNKSPLEIIQAYRELEKDRGRLASELGETRKSQEELQDRFKQLEIQGMQYQAPPTQTTPQPQEAPKPEDPFKIDREYFENDPAGAVEKLAQKQYEQILQQTQAQNMQQQAAEATQYYYNQKRDNPDYGRREPIMQQLYSEYQGIIRPEYANSAKVLKALDLMSKGMDLSYYTKQAVEKAQQDGLSVLEEKRRAQSETSHSEGEQSVQFESLSLEDMERMLPKSDD